MDGWRQIIKTPTFALGLSVVAAAVLAFGTTQTYLRFSGSGPGPGPGCGPVNCADPASSPSTSQAAAGSAKAAARNVQVTYHTVSTSPTAFTGELVIRNRSNHALSGWHLTISYETTQITDVAGANWQPRAGSTSATIGPRPPSSPLGAGGSVRVTYTATGAPHAPSGCDFNGIRCHIR